jgi:hypothetical protein
MTACPSRNVALLGIRRRAESRSSVHCVPSVPNVSNVPGVPSVSETHTLDELQDLKRTAVSSTAGETCQLKYF